jgi:hypothetical protein
MTESQSWYAANARNLLSTRRQGLAPQGPVVVSLVGQEFEQTALYLRPDVAPDRFDWRMLVNLDVWVWASPAASLDWVIETVWRIAKSRPAELALRFEHGDKTHDIDCGTGIHHPAIADIPAVHEFIWLPINTGGSALGYRILRALTAQHPKGQML